MTALRERDFRQLWLAGLISDTGDWMLLVSLPVLVYQLTGSALGTSVAFLTELLPAVLVAPLAGRLADRVNRRALLVIVSLIQALMLLPLLAGPRLPVVYIVIAAEAGLAAFFDPAKNALLPTLVDEAQLVSANSLTGLNQNLGRLAGGSLGGLLLAAGDLRVIAAADAATFVAAAALIAGLRSAQPAAGANLRSGAGHPFRRRPVRAGLAVLALTSVGQGLFVVLFVVFVARVLHGNAAENGLLRAVQAIGSIGGGLVLARASRIRSGRLASVACLSFGALAIATWNLPGVTLAEPVYVALFIAFGVPSIALVTGLVAALQQATLDGERGRVIAACGVAMAVGQAAGVGLAGLLGDRLGVIPLLDGQAALYLIGGLAALAWLAERAAPARHARPITVILGVPCPAIGPRPSRCRRPAAYTRAER